MELNNFPVIKILQFSALFAYFVLLIFIKKMNLKMHIYALLVLINNSFEVINTLKILSIFFLMEFMLN